MIERKAFTQEDCLETGYAMSIAGRVIVLKQSLLPEKYQDSLHQLYFCNGGNGSNPNPIGRSVFTVALADGTHVRWNRSDVLGTLKPNLLPDLARLQLSQIRPCDAAELREAEPKYSGYSFLPDGRYSAGVWLADEKEAMKYIKMQKDYQHRVMLCDRNDFCVFEMVKGKVIYPSQEVIEEFLLEQQDSGMNIKL